MISRKQIASIKMAQKEAGIADEQYRALLLQVAGVRSCKDLDSKSVVEVLNEIRKYNADETSALPGPYDGRRDNSEHRKGWQRRQISTWNKYVRYCKMSDLEAAQLLHRCTGISDPEASRLSQANFDDAIATIEHELDGLVKAGEVSLPMGVDLQYWRNRKPKIGMVNKREIFQINKRWHELQGYLSEENRNEEYLLAIIAHACGYQQQRPVEQLPARDALTVINCLKMRIKQCQAALERQNLPF